MQKMILVLLALASSADAAKLVSLTEQLTAAKIPLRQADGIWYVTVREPNSGELVAVGLDGDGRGGKPLRSITTLYDGMSFDGGMYGLGFLMASAHLCLSQTQAAGEDGAAFIQQAVQRGLTSGNGSFQKTFGKLRYTVTASHYLTGRQRIRINMAIPATAPARCTL